MAQDLGADGVMVTPAKEPVPNEDRIIELYQQIGQNISIPIVLQDQPASTDVHMPAGLIVRIVRAVASIACVKEEAVPAAPKIRQVREGAGEWQMTILSGIGGLYAPFDLEAGSDRQLAIRSYDTYTPSARSSSVRNSVRLLAGVEAAA